MNDKRREELLAELIAFTTPPAPEDDEFLVQGVVEFCKAHGIKREDGKPMNKETVRYRLDRMVELGFMTKRPVLYKRKWPHAYRFTDKYTGQGNLYDGWLDREAD